MRCWGEKWTKHCIHIWIKNFKKDEMLSSLAPVVCESVFLRICYRVMSKQVLNPLFQCVHDCHVLCLLYSVQWQEAVVPVEGSFQLLTMNCGASSVSSHNARAGRVMTPTKTKMSNTYNLWMLHGRRQLKVISWSEIKDFLGKPRGLKSGRGSWVSVAHTYNPSYTGGRAQEDHGSKPAPGH
jgi:hypothetical protein